MRDPGITFWSQEVTLEGATKGLNLWKEAGPERHLSFRDFHKSAPLLKSGRRVHKCNRVGGNALKGFLEPA